jgi:flagellar operon protein
MNQLITGSFTSIEQATGSIGRTNKAKELNADHKLNGLSFEDILNQKKSIEEVIDDSGVKISPLKFSKHAGERLEERDIQLTNEQMARLEEGTRKASSKGIKESLVLLDNMAFIVNTQNSTVITAMNQTNNEENIYTNIDGAVII